MDLASDFAGLLERELFRTLPISAEHAVRAGLLPGPHNDPFDRMLMAQAQAENVPIFSMATACAESGKRYGVLLTRHSVLALNHRLRTLHGSDSLPAP